MSCLLTTNSCVLCDLDVNEKMQIACSSLHNWVGNLLANNMRTSTYLSSWCCRTAGLFRSDHPLRQSTTTAMNTFVVGEHAFHRSSKTLRATSTLHHHRFIFAAADDLLFAWICLWVVVVVFINARVNK
jgi:hypothetical protein